jgi:hypothetical protein
MSTAVQDILPKLSKDLRAASATLSRTEARFLVDTYYQYQDARIRSGNQVRSMDDADEPEPHETLTWFGIAQSNLEEQVKKALQVYAEANPVGRWLMSIVGIGPVIAAGLLAHIDITKVTDEGKRITSFGQIWRYAGLDPTVKWNKGEKRPFNASLKLICWKLGESFVKTANHKNSFYGHFYIERKKREWDRNFAGRFVGQAQASLDAKNFKKNTDAYVWYSGQYAVPPGTTFNGESVEEIKAMLIKVAAGQGLQMLPPARIHLRATRYPVKLLLSHLFEKLWWQEYGTAPPSAYAIAHMDHVDYIAPPE